MTSTGSNPFKDADTWVDSAGVLPEGNYVVTVDSAEDGTSSGGHPQVELQLKCDQGEIRDWLVITPNTTGKVKQVVEAMGADFPEDGEYDAASLRLDQGYLDTWVGKQVGIIVRSEPDYKDPTKTRERVRAYCPASRIAEVGSNGGDTVDAAAEASVPASAPASEQPLPF